mgnify:CR=1 FL=1
MKNILLITTMYPTPESKIHTPVVHYFAKEWIKMGYNVKVIHFRTVFPIYLYWIGSLFKKIAARYIGNDYIEIKQNKKVNIFFKDDVHVHSFPIFKLFPHGRFLSSTIRYNIRKIITIIKSNNFTPDLIIGHFHNPQIEIVSKLKSVYPSTRTCIVLHEDASMIKKTYPKAYLSYMSNIDVWGFRSAILKNSFDSVFNNVEKKFICYSGIPECYIKKDEIRTFTKDISSFIYIGHLMERKYPSVLVSSVNKVINNGDFKIKYIGKGNKKLEILSLAKELNISNSIIFTGKLTREEVINHLDQSDCFIMISKDEVFGLVYLEAMARGCITIGSRNEGIDGVIEHGVNGFLCEAGNGDELAKLLLFINSLSQEKLKEISLNAKKTAFNMTDYNIAKNYINFVLN